MVATNSHPLSSGYYIWSHLEYADPLPILKITIFVLKIIRVANIEIAHT